MKGMKRLFCLWIAAFVCMEGCAPATIATAGLKSPTATGTVLFSPTAGLTATALPFLKTPGKLSARMQLLAHSTTLWEASPAEQARALSLPAQGPGSLIRDQKNRILVDIRGSDLSGTTQQAVQTMGVVITHTSPDQHLLTAFVNPKDLISIEALPGVESITEELKPMISGGTVPTH